MSDNYKLSLVRDSSMEVSQNLDVAVFRGAQEVNCITVPADGLSTGQLQFSYTVPSLETITNKRMYVRLTQTFKVNRTAPAAAAGKSVFQYGVNAALNAYGALRGLTTIQLSMNNNTTTTDFTQCFDEIMRLYDSKSHKDIHSMCPNQLDDFYSDFADGIGGVNNVLGGFDFADRFKVPRGAFDVVIGTAYANNAVTPSADVPVFPAPAGAVCISPDIYVQYTMTVPLPCSPLTFNDSLENSGVNGLNKLNVQVNFGNSAGNSSLMSCTVKPGVNETGLVTSPVAFDKADLLLTSYTAYADSRVEPSCILPYFNLDTRNYAVGAATSAAPTISFSTQSITVNQIPDLIIVSVGRKKSEKRSWDADSYYTVNSCSINFCERSGLLASATPQQLFTFSKEAGYPLGWQQWSGKAYNVSAVDGAGVATLNKVNTIGSMLCLIPGKHISLPANVAPGSVFNAQLTISNLNVTANYSNAQWAAKNNTENVECRIILVSSGSFSIANGSAVQQVGLIGSSDIARVISDAGSYSDNVKRHYGAGMPDKLSAAFKTLSPHAVKYASAPKVGTGMLGGARLGGAKHSRL